MTTLIDHLNPSTPVTLNALMKLTGLTQTGLTLELVKLGGRVSVEGGGIILAPAPVTPEPSPSSDRPLLVGFVGRRPKAVRVNEIAVCRELILDTVRNTGSASAPAVHKDSGFSVDYRNLGRAAIELISEGLIREEKRGRLRVWVAA